MNNQEEKKLLEMICRLDGAIAAQKVLRKQKAQFAKIAEENEQDLDNINQQFQEYYRDKTKKK